MFALSQQKKNTNDYGGDGKKKTNKTKQSNKNDDISKNQMTELGNFSFMWVMYGNRKVS